METLSAAADDSSRGAKPGAGGRRDRRSRSLRVAHPGRLRERGAGLGGPGRGWARAGACGGFPAKRNRPVAGRSRGRGPRPGGEKVKARRPLPQSAHQVFINKPGTL